MRYEQLNLISAKRIAAICHQQLYQKRMAKAYDKKVRPRVFQEGDLVLKKNQMTCHLVHRSDGLTSLTRKSCLSGYLSEHLMLHLFTIFDKTYTIMIA